MSKNTGVTSTVGFRSILSPKVNKQSTNNDVADG